jgi:hypothetical protein
LPRPAAFTADTSVEKSSLLEAMSTTVCALAAVDGGSMVDETVVGVLFEGESLALLLDEQLASANVAVAATATARPRRRIVGCIGEMSFRVGGFACPSAPSRDPDDI